MNRIEVGPEAKSMLMRLFMEGYISCPEPLTGEEIEALCLLTGLQVVAAHRVSGAFRAEVLDTMREASRRTGSPLIGATFETEGAGE